MMKKYKEIKMEISYEKQNIWIVIYRIKDNFSLNGLYILDFLIKLIINIYNIIKRDYKWNN